MQLQLLTVVELTRHLDASSRLERPALAPSVIDNHLHIVVMLVVMLVVTLLLHRSNVQSLKRHRYDHQHHYRQTLDPGQLYSLCR